MFCFESLKSSLARKIDECVSVSCCFYCWTFAWFVSRFANACITISRLFRISFFFTCVCTENKTRRNSLGSLVAACNIVTLSLCIKFSEIQILNVINELKIIYSIYMIRKWISRNPLFGAVDFHESFFIWLRQRKFINISIYASIDSHVLPFFIFSASYHTIVWISLAFEIYGSLFVSIPQGHSPWSIYYAQRLTYLFRLNREKKKYPAEMLAKAKLSGDIWRRPFDIYVFFFSHKFIGT